MINLQDLVAVCTTFANLGENIGQQITAAVDENLNDGNWNPGTTRQLRAFLKEVVNLDPGRLGPQADEVMMYVYSINEDYDG